MYAQRLYSPNDLRWEETEVPELGTHDVRIKVEYCGVCGTDYAIWSGQTSFYEMGLIRTPMTLGHEYSGVIDAVGDAVTRFKKGDRVVSDTGVSCGICEVCLRGDYLHCDTMQAVGTINCIDGGYAQYTVMPERHVFPIPDEASYEMGALCEPVATAMYAVERPQIKLGDTVMIIGTGPIGLAAVSLAKLKGAGKIILIGRKAGKLDIGRKFGADFCINTANEDPAERVTELTNSKGVNVIIEASGAGEMLHFAFDCIALGGRISLVSFYEKNINDLNINKIVLNDLAVFGIMGSPNMGPAVIKLIKSGRLDLTPMITAVYPLEQAQQALIASKQKDAEHIKILLKP